MVTTPPRAPQRSVAEHRADAVLGAAAVLGYVVVLSLAMQRLSYDIWGALVVAPLLLVATIPLLARAARREADPWVLRILVAALLAKMLGAVVRYAVTFDLYAGRADAGGYHGSGRRIAAAFWGGNLDEVLPQEVPNLVGTEFMRLATGIVYVVTGPTKLGGFLVFAWLSFLGLYWCYRAFRIGFPEGDARRYAILVLFMPSLLYWPSSIGKEAWMLFTLGLASLGVAMVLRGRGGGYPVLALGLAGTALVRPYVGLLVVVALLVASLVRRRPWSETRFALLGRLAGLAVVVAMAAALLGQVSDFFNLEDVDREAVDQVLDRTGDQSAKGGSEFEGARPASLGEFPLALVTVLFRPFPWEAGNAQALVASLEGLVLLVLVVLALPRLVRLPAFMARVPYVTYAVVFSLLFVFAFSSISNFGIIARQRTQVFPFVLVVLALPALAPTRAAPSRQSASPR